MNNFRLRLYPYKTEEDLWDYFCEHAGYNEEMQIYQCAGIVSNDTKDLWSELKKEWEEDIKNRAKEVLSD